VARGGTGAMAGGFEVVGLRRGRFRGHLAPTCRRRCLTSSRFMSNSSKASMSVRHRNSPAVLIPLRGERGRGKDAAGPSMIEKGMARRPQGEWGISCV